MNDDDRTFIRIAREQDYSRQLFHNRFNTQPVHIISVRSIRGHCIVIGEVAGKRTRVIFDFTDVDLGADPPQN